MPTTDAAATTVTPDALTGPELDAVRLERVARRNETRGPALAARRAEVLAPDNLRAVLLSPLGVLAVQRALRAATRGQDGQPRPSDVRQALETLLGPTPTTKR